MADYIISSWADGAPARISAISKSTLSMPTTYHLASKLPNPANLHNPPSTSIPPFAGPPPGPLAQGSCLGAASRSLGEPGGSHTGTPPGDPGSGRSWKE